MLSGFLKRPNQSKFKAMLLTSSLLSVGWSVSAAAQLNVAPPTKIATDENNVNTLSGQIQLPSQIISIGPEEDPLVYEDYNGTGSPNFRLDLWTSSMPTGFDIRASVLNDGYARSKAFFRGYSTPSGTVLTDGEGGSLSQNGSISTVTISDGTNYIYGNADLQTSDATGGQGWTGRVTEIVRPDGLRTNLSYKKVTYTCPNSYCSSTGGSKETKVRLQSVSRSDGYQLHFNYVSNLTGTGAQQQDWNKIASVGGV
jgi:hypothetical protein